MRKFTEYIGFQFGNPRGMIGKICCVIMNVMNNALYRKVVSILNVKGVNAKEQAKMLDIGYGNGYLIQKLYRKFHAEIYGIDISKDMKEQASRRNKKGVSDGRIHLEIGDCCNLTFQDECFDVITSINTIYFWENTLKGLGEIFRTLKQGGTFYNVVYTKEWLQKLSYTRKGFQFFEKEDYIRLGKQAGFVDVVIEDIIKGKSFVVVYKK